MKAIIMAGGKGTRLATADNPLPKVLREANARPLLSYVLDSIDFIAPEDITVVVGYMKEKVRQSFADHGCRFATQDDAAYGTGYAVMCAMRGDDLANCHDDIIVLSGDVPLIRTSTIRAMFDMHRRDGNSCTMLSCRSDRPLPFGRVVRENGKVTAIVEDKDCTPEQKKITELNVGLYIFNADLLRSALARITNNNAQHEYYLTDVPALMLADGAKFDAYVTEDETEMLGVNTFEDLALVEEILRAGGRH